MGVKALERIVVVGTSCCGKSALSIELARLLGRSRIELDELFWGPGWTPKPENEFRRLTATAASAPLWIADGNYGGVRDVLWPRATIIIWLNYSFFTVLFRALRRTVSRNITKEELWHGNRESFRRSFLSRESIFVWVITTFYQRRREFQALRASNDYPHLSWIEFRRPSEAGRYLASLGPRLRPAKFTDAPAIAACVNAAYQHYVDRIGKAPAPMLDDYARIIAESQVSVAEQNGAMVGVIVLSVADNCFFVDNVAVEPSHQGLGIGRMLLEFAENEAQRESFESINLYTHERMVENQLLYAKIGYVEYDRLVENGYSRIYMRKILT